MLKQGLELKQTQKLSPLQIQTIKLIELPAQELEQRIRKELEENPVLDENVAKETDDTEEGPREVSLSEYKEDDSIPSYRLRVNNYGKDERPQYNTFSVKESFTQSLMDQLGFRNLTEHQHSVASFIIGSLDDDGYLRRDKWVHGICGNAFSCRYAISSARQTLKMRKRYSGTISPNSPTSISRR